MLLLIHIIIALLSIAITTIAYISPSKSKLYISYGTVGLTLITGVALIVAAPSYLVMACISGVLYLSVVASGTIAVQRKLSARPTHL